MGGKIARHTTLALALGLALASMRCAVQVVNTKTAVVRSDTTELVTNLDVRSEPTSERPVARFRAYSTAFVKDTRVRTSTVKYRPVPAVWATTVAASLAGGVAYLWLSRSGRVVLGRDILAVSIGPLAGMALASLGTFRRTATLIDTSRLTTPLPVVVKCGGTQVATLGPDSYGGASLELKDHLGSLPVLTSDTVLTVTAVGAQVPSRDLSLTRAAYAAAIEAHRVDVEQQARAKRDMAAAIERARQDSIAQVRQAKQDSVARAYRAAAALDRIVASLDETDLELLRRKLMYADAEFQAIVAMPRIAKPLGISSYGDFLGLPMRSRVWALREIAHMSGGESFTASLLLQEVLHIPAYLAEKILR